jgi:hypothetical protein
MSLFVCCGSLVVCALRDVDHDCLRCVHHLQDVATSSFLTGALRELTVALVKGNRLVYREALHVYATAGGTAARAAAWVPTVDPQ